MIVVREIMVIGEWAKSIERFQRKDERYNNSTASIFREQWIRGFVFWIKQLLEKVREYMVTVVFF